MRQHVQKLAVCRLLHAVHVDGDEAVVERGELREDLRRLAYAGVGVAVGDDHGDERARRVAREREDGAYGGKDVGPAVGGEAAEPAVGALETFLVALRPRVEAVGELVAEGDEIEAVSGVGGGAQNPAGGVPARLQAVFADGAGGVEQHYQVLRRGDEFRTRREADAEVGPVAFLRTVR